ncbi:JAB domain-containing protein similar to deubiquitination enzymes [Pseudomonas sp. SJZ080]|uniref:ThiF family adenylyltransferase n=1 Tax=Pseudomonas sp. SJZ080 TaxID=2572888 RepID=UPI00119B198C|nr:ThiF family adenylyltransferase [Pseudomonas sp. SJZ080]TWC50926.1 JAB domain-containing protein similar to deubiquitination enzymes [Pseudomonas sp. SJZ080]
MKTGATFVMTEALHTALREHLFPGDGLEAAAIVLCTRYEGKRTKLIAKSMISVPYDVCERRGDFLRWPGDYLERAISESEAAQLSIMLIHSHPGGFLGFSELDDESDRITMRSLFAGVEVIHGSAIMIPDGTIAARLYDASQCPTDIALVSVIGDDIRLYFNGIDGCALIDGKSRVPLAFTSEMTQALSKLSVAVIGVSGTGSVVAEQVTRLGFGEIILIDHDRVEPRNLNRILNSTTADAESSAFKVEMFADAIERVRGKGVAYPVSKSVGTREAVLAAADADILFCCVDTRFARMIADRLASRFLIPLFDVGVLIPTMKVEAVGMTIAGVYGRIDYVKPGGASLADREVYTGESLRAESLRAANPEVYQQQLQHGYIQGFHEEAPAVISLNMLAASTCVMEFLARAFPMREESNANYARTLIKFREAEQEFTAESGFRHTPDSGLALGAAEPLLGIADLSGGF